MTKSIIIMLMMAMTTDVGSAVLVRTHPAPRARARVPVCAASARQLGASCYASLRGGDGPRGAALAWHAARGGKAAADDWWAPPANAVGTAAALLRGLQGYRPLTMVDAKGGEYALDKPGLDMSK
jgi:hypothetical protein